ncbi:MAG TPA: methyl-accepting chemotaxis protein [Usitatibacter sp.]|nr:methyl-accepting chemotaxis protein [Usitatibacter sp.]
MSVRKRLVLLGLFTNVLLVVAVCVGALASWRVSLSFEAATKQQERIAQAAEQARKAEIAFRTETAEYANVLLRDAESRDSHLRAFESAGTEVDRGLAALGPMLDVIGFDPANAAELRREHSALLARYQAALKGFAGDAGSGVVLDRALRAVDRELAEHLAEFGGKIRGLATEQIKYDALMAEQERVKMLVWLAIVTGFTLVVSSVVGYWNAHSLVPPLDRVVKLAHSVAAGDLTERIQTDRRDELGHVLNSLRDMNESLLGIVTRVQEGAEAVMGASSQIAASNYDLASRTEAQASSLEETAASIEEMTAAVDQNAQHAKRANALASSAATVARRGGDMVQQMVGRMDEIQARSRKISEIIGLIDSIAFQTNILALNAAVEAARAGESGRGFAVVATEVRQLAQRSAEAARQIKDLIGGAVEAVNAGAMLADDAGRTMLDVTASVNDVSSIIGQIATATAEQQVGISQINQAVTELDRVTQRNASMAQESTQAAQALKQMAQRLEQAVGFFKVHAGAVTAPRAPSALQKRASAIALIPAPGAGD